MMKKDTNKILSSLILTTVSVLTITACQSVKTTAVTMTSLPQTTSKAEATQTTPANTTTLSGVNSASSDSIDGLSLFLSLDSTTYQPGQAVIITIDETNTLPKTNNVPASDKWPLSALGVGPCGPINYPFGVTIFQGNYSSSDVLFATPLKFYNPQAVYGCPMILSGISTYVFQPSSSTAAIFQNSSASPVLTESMNSEVESMGYWVASPNETLTEFDPGVYTVVGGDEWGSLVVVHFTVSGTSTTTATISTTNTNVTQDQQPIEIVSALGPVPPFTPGGPEIEITLKNVSNEPVVSLTAIFTNLGSRDFDFEFAVSNSNPLLSGISISDSLTLIGAGFDTNVSYPLTIEGTLQDGVTFNYVLQIEIVEPSN